MARLLIVDPVSARPYQDRTLYDRSLGDVEAGVIRVAEGLAQRGHRVTVAQSARSWPSRSPGGVAYVPFDYYGGWGHLPHAEAVVVVGQAKVLAKVRKRFRDARLAVWIGDVPGRRRRALGALAAAADATVVCVSDAHQAAVREVLAATDGWARTASVPRPVDDALSPDATPVDPDKLVTFATPSAGLGEVLAAFARVRAVRPRARLYVVGGAGEGRPALPAGAIPLGPLPHHAALRHVREAFALFMPQAGVAEVCGRCYAEANAVGTPAIAHPHAAVREALAETPTERRQLVDAREPDAAARRLLQWWDEGRPAVEAPRQARTSRVVAEWERVLGVAAQAPRLLRTARPARPMTPVAA